MIIRQSWFREIIIAKTKRIEIFFHAEGIMIVKENRVFVTGRAGFLGSHLCERLIKDGNEVSLTGKRINHVQTN